MNRHHPLAVLLRDPLRRGGATLGAIVLVIAVIGAQLLVVDAGAEPVASQYLAVQKRVDGAAHADLVPGQTFTYAIDVRCVEESCLDAQMVDPLPPELAGWPLLGVATSPSAATIPREVTWTEAGSPIAEPTHVGPETTLTVDFTGSLTDHPTGVGLEFGNTFNVHLTLQVPASLGPGTYEATNTAATTATNSAPDDSTATIEVVVAEEVGVALAKSWTPATAGYVVGTPSQIGLVGANDSNVTASSLTIQEPDVAPDGAGSLAASNPFSIADLVAVAAPLPVGATAVQIDAYVLDGTTWSWQAGVPSATATLPAGVAVADVGGLRVTYTGAIAPGASASTTLDLALRATHRDSALDLSLDSHSVANVASAAVVAPGHPPARTTDDASYTVTPPTVAAEADKDIVPGRISAGDVADATISGRNRSDIGVDELRLADLGFFTVDIAFGGFTAPISWPAGATGAAVVYHPLAGGPPAAPVVFADGTTPPGPAGAISGFELVFTAADGGITAGAGTSATFEIATTEDAPGTETEVRVTNAVDVSVIAPNGLDDSDRATDDLELVLPGIAVELTKSVLPATAVHVGDAVVVGLEAVLTTTSSYVTADEIVVTDAWDGTVGTFWDAFALRSIPAVQMPSGSILTVAVQTGVGTWTTVDTVGPVVGPSMSDPLVAADLAPLDIGDVTGVRFTVEHPSGFADATTVVPYLVTQARSTLRTGGAVADDPELPTSHPNAASVAASGTTPSGSALDDTDGDVGEVGVLPTDGAGPVGIDKSWSQANVASQSGQQRSTTLSWSVGTGFATVAIADPVDPSLTEDTVFDAFDLVRLRPVAYGSGTFTNGWYLRYDTVTTIELYRAGAWQSVPAPPGGWHNSTGFVGYTLTSTERADATGIRVTLEEDTAARVAAQQEGTYDPFAPEPGTGVAASSGSRALTLDWRIRNTPRVGAGFVTADRTYNTGDDGVVLNTVGLTAQPIAPGPAATDSGSDPIVLIDHLPGVVVDKTVAPAGPLYTPVAGTDPSTYPTATYTITARNDSVARATHVQVADPPVCLDGAPVGDCQSAATAAGAVANPYADLGVDWLARTGGANVFDRFDLLDVAIAPSIADEVDLSSSVVWLLHHDTSTGAYSTTASTASAVNAMDAAALADVVGISVTFQGTSPAVAGGSITAANDLTLTLTTRLRATIRSTGVDQVLRAGETHTATNRSFAQSFDPVLSPGTATGDLDAVDIVLTGGVLDVAGTKSISPGTITEPLRRAPVTVTLGANHGGSTVSPDQVWLRDDVASSPEFWGRFDLVGLGPVTAPAGADRVAIDVYGPFGPGGAMTWETGTPAAIAAADLPVTGADVAAVQGIRATFTRDDGAVFSSLLPSPGWSASVVLTAELRDADRTSGAPIDFPAETDTPVTNTVTVRSARGADLSSERTRSATVVLTDGTQELSVAKLANEGNRFANPGVTIPWDLTFANTGTGYLTIAEVRDTLPEWLVHLGDPTPTFTAGSGGLLSEDVGVATDGADLVFTWPEEGRTMAPGESFTIRIHLEVQPGVGTLGSGREAVNTMTVRTVETLDACDHLASGATTGAWATDARTCGTTDHVEPVIGPNLFTVKGVRGHLDGAFHPTNPAMSCTPTLAVGGADYFRSPCVAHSVLGGIDSWVLRAMNAGTVSVSEMTIFDGLPALDDTFLVSGADRGSSFRPQVVAGSLEVHAPAGTVEVVEVTSDPAVCLGTWNDLADHVPCEQNGETWTVADATTDWSQVTGLRIHLDFSATAAGELVSGEVVDVLFDTVNVARSTADPDGAPVDVPADDALAWNQFGVRYRNAGGASFEKLAPSRVGVHLLVGPLRIDKVVTGDAAASAPAEFLVDLSCTIGDVALSMGSDAVVVLDDASGWSHRVDGIPVGATCTVVEQGDVGHFGESSRGGSPAAVEVLVAAGSTEPVPAAQVATVVNVYDAPPTDPADPGEPERPGGADEATSGTDGIDVDASDADADVLPRPLPRTGSNATAPLLLALALLAAGGVMAFVGRRHRTRGRVL